MKVYLSGPMSGLPDNNYPTFNKGAKVLRMLGYDVVNPAENDIDVQGLDDDAAWHKYLRHDIKLLMDCDCLVLLPGWPDSRGATLERLIAQSLSMPVMTFANAVLEFGFVDSKP